MNAERVLELDAARHAAFLAAEYGTEGGPWDWNEAAWVALGECLHADSPWVEFYETELEAAWYQLINKGSE